MVFRDRTHVWFLINSCFFVSKNYSIPLHKIHKIFFAVSSFSKSSSNSQSFCRNSGNYRIWSHPCNDGNRTHDGVRSTCTLPFMTAPEPINNFPISQWLGYFHMMFHSLPIINMPMYNIMVGMYVGRDSHIIMYFY